IDEPARTGAEGDLAPAAVDPGHRNLPDDQARPPRQEEDLDIEAESFELLQRKERLRRAAAEQLEPALRVVDAAQHQQLHHPVEDAADDMPEQRLADAAGAGGFTGSNKDVAARI